MCALLQPGLCSSEVAKKITTLARNKNPARTEPAAQRRPPIVTTAPKLVGLMVNHRTTSVGAIAMRMQNVPAKKLNLGLGFYGRSIQLADPGCSKPGCNFKAGRRPTPVQRIPVRCRIKKSQRSSTRRSLSLYTTRKVPSSMSYGIRTNGSPTTKKKPSSKRLI